jgi:hypothetical protein
LPPSSRPSDAAIREEQMATVAEIVAAGATLLLDWAEGSVQRTRTANCGDPKCGYAGCRLADAINVYAKIADKEPV